MQCSSAVQLVTVGCSVAVYSSWGAGEFGPVFYSDSVQHRLRISLCRVSDHQKLERQEVSANVPRPRLAHCSRSAHPALCGPDLLSAADRCRDKNIARRDTQDARRHHWRRHVHCAAAGIFHSSLATGQHCLPLLAHHYPTLLAAAGSLVCSASGFARAVCSVVGMLICI